MSHGKLAILPPSPGLIRRLALNHARQNLDRFLDTARPVGSVSWTHRPSEADVTPEVAAEQAAKEIGQAERGLMVNSLMAAEQASDQLRALPVYCSRAVVTHALAFFADDLRSGRPVPIAVHDCPGNFDPWTRAELADAADAERKAITQAPSAPLRW